MYEIINGVQMPVREYNGQRVVTFRDIDSVHQRPEGTARRNFNKNMKHFIEGVDYFIVRPSDFQMYEIRTSEINNRGTTLVTLTGYLMIVKSLKDDLSWGVQRMLVTYFTAREQDNNYPDLLRRQNELESRVALLENRLALPENKTPEKNIRWEDAEYVLEKLNASGEQVFTKHRVLILCRPLRAIQVTPALETLDRMNIISYRKIFRIGGGNPKEIIEIKGGGGNAGGM